MVVTDKIVVLVAVFKLTVRNSRGDRLFIIFMQHRVTLTLHLLWLPTARQPANQYEKINIVANKEVCWQTSSGYCQRCGYN